MMHFEVYESTDGWHWRLEAANGEITASGEAYATKGSAKRGIRAIKKEIAAAPIITIDSTVPANAVEESHGY